MKRSLACILIIALLVTAIPLGSLAGSATTVQYGVVHGGWLRLRQQPSFSATTLTSYYTGTKLTIYGYTNGWYQVTGPDGKSGYCYAYYVTLNGSGGGGGSTGGYDAWVTSTNGKSVRLRSGPSTSYGVVASYPVGTQVSVLTHGTYWDYIQVGTTRGYMMTQFLTTGSPITPPSGSYTARVTSTNGYGVRLRTGPGTGYSIIGVYSVGTNVVVLNHGTTWDYIRIGTRVGYMMNKFLIATGQSATVGSVTLNDNDPVVGGTLYVSAITPAAATVTYSWRTVRSGVETEVYTGASYTPSSLDIGAQIKLVVTGTGYYTGSASATTTGTVVASQALTAVTINNLNPAVGDVLSPVVTPATAKADYIWYVGGIQKATTPTYTVTTADVGLKIKVSATAKGGYTGSQTSLETNAVTATGTVTGATIDNMSPREGDVLTANPVPVTATVTYRWIDGSNNELGTGKTYTVTAKNATDGIAIRVVVTGQGNYAGSSATSSPTATVVAATPLTGLTLKPAQPYLGDTVTVDAIAPSTATEANLTDYHWYVNNVEVTAAAGQTSFVLNQSSYENAVIKLTVTGKDGYKGTVSGATAAVGKARTLTGTPTITGEAKVKATLTANLNDIPAAANVTYEWFVDGVTTSTTGATFVVRVSDYTKGVTVRATAASGSGYAGTVTSAATAITVPADLSGTPVVTGTTVVGQTLTAGRGTLPTDLSDANIDYYWVRNNTAISGAVGGTYVLTSADAGASISVVAVGKANSGYSPDPAKGVRSNSVGPVTAPSVSIPLTGIPSITPASATVGTQLTAGLGNTNVPSGYTDVTWTWYANGSQIATGAQYTPATTDTLTLRMTANTGTSYTGYVELTGIVVTVPIGTAPSITTDPTGQTVTEGTTATFTAAATGTPTPSYRWQRKGPADSDFADITGETNATLNVTGTTVAMSGTQYRCVAANGISPDAASNPATLTVNPAAPTGTAPSITTDPSNQTVTEGATATFTVAATGTPTLTYRWQSNTGSDFTDMGVTTATLTLTNTTAAMSGTQYRCVVANGTSPDAISNAATLTVNPAAPTGTAPSIGTEPLDQTVTEGDTATFTVAATGDPAPTYRWQSNTGSDFVDMGVTTATLTLTNTTAAMSGTQYRCVVENGVTPKAVSNVVTLTVNSVAPVGVAPTIDSEPTDQTVTEGATATFTVAASGTPTPTYRWQMDTGSDFVDMGITTATLTLTNTTAAMSGNRYRCVVENGTDPKAVSAIVTLTVNPVVTP